MKLKHLVIYLSCILINNCANSSVKKIDFYAKNVKSDQLQEVTIYNGKVKVLRFPVEKDQKTLEVSCDNRRVPTRIVKDHLELILLAGYYSPDREFICESIHTEGKTPILKIKVSQFAYKENCFNCTTWQSCIICERSTQGCKGTKNIKCNILSTNSRAYLFRPFYHSFNLRKNKYLW
jgi:hypothetical protein